MTWEYIAGFFDGEGSISRNGNGFRISIPQTNEKVLREVRAFSGMGYVCKVSKRKLHWKESWTYYIAKQEHVYLFLKNISNFIIVKKPLTKSLLPGLKKRVAIHRKQKIAFEKRKELAIRLRRYGMSYRKIGEEIGLDYGYTRRLIKRHVQTY